MYVKGHKKTVGIPQATIRLVAGHADIHLANQVVVLIKHAVTGDVVASMRLSTAEAYELSQDLRRTADDAQRADAVEQRIKERDRA